MLSYNIKPTLDALTSTQRGRACAGRRNTQYWLALDLDSDTSHRRESVYVLDYVFGIWGKYLCADFGTVMITGKDGTLYSGLTTQGDMIQWDTGTDDRGTAISLSWYSPQYDFGDWTAVKHPLDVIVSAKAISGKTITVSHFVDGVLKSQTLPFSLTPSGSQTKVFLKKRHISGQSYGGYIQFAFDNAELAAAVEIYAFSIGAYVDKRQNG